MATMRSYGLFQLMQNCILNNSNVAMYVFFLNEKRENGSYITRLIFYLEESTRAILVAHRVVYGVHIFSMR